MCITCLKNELPVIDDYDKDVNERLASITCECCKTYPTFLLEVNTDLRVLCLTKIKRHEQVCPNGIRKLKQFESMVKLRIKNKLNDVLEQIDNKSHEYKEQDYLNRMNELKDLNDYVGILDEADHN